jgi:hypothetical protein
MPWSVTESGEQVTLSRDDNPTGNFATFRKSSEQETEKLRELARLLTERESTEKDQ